jgi:hypothetical protein
MSPKRQRGKGEGKWRKVLEHLYRNEGWMRRGRAGTFLS